MTFKVGDKVHFYAKGVTSRTLGFITHVGASLCTVLWLDPPYGRQWSGQYNYDRLRISPMSLVDEDTE